MFTDFLSDHETLLWLLGVISLVTFIASLIAIPWLIVRIPYDYFAPDKVRVPPWTGAHPTVRWVLLIGKNLLGALLVLLGIAMLVLPGQGVLGILLGITLIDFPGKYRLERWLILRKPVLFAVNALRKRARREPLRFDEATP